MLNQFFITGALPANIIVGHYIPLMVIASYLVASIGAFTGLTLAARIFTVAAEKKRLLQWAGAFSLGSGVWSMHFIGMLAYDMNMAHEYNPWLTLFSGLIAITVAWFVLEITQGATLTWKRLSISAISLGLGITAMHYTGMAAMEMNASLRYVPSLFMLSVFIAIAASGAALWIIFTLGRHVGRRQTLWRVTAALIMGLAVCGMHYTGVAASVIIPFADCRFGDAQSFSLLEVSIILITGLICIISLMLGVANRLAVLVACAAIFSLPVGIIIYQAISALNTNIEFAEKEQHGVLYHKELMDLLISMQKLRGLTNIYQNGDTSVKAAILKQNKDAIERIKKIDTADMVHGEGLALHQEWQDIKAAFPDLFEEHRPVRHQDAEKEFAAHTAIIQTLVNFMEQVVDHSNVTADQQLDSNFLAEISFNTIPQITETLGQMRGLASGNLALGNYPPAKWSQPEIEKLQSLHHNLNLLDEIMRNKLIRAQQLNASTGRFLVQYNMDIKPKLDHFQQLYKRMVFQHETSWSSQSLFNQATDLIQQYNVFYDHAADELFNVLEQRQNGYSAKQNLVLSASLSGFFGFVALFIFLLRSLTRTEHAERDARHARKTAEQAAAAKSDFLANMSHELRTPMNGVLGMAHLLADTNLNAEQREYVATINGSGENLLMLLNDILDFSKIEAGALMLEHIAYDPKHAITGTVNLLRPQADKKHIELQLECETDVPAYIWGDPGRVRQIITNLLGNAIKFTEQGYVRLTARLQEQHNGNWLHISVEDTGIGMAANKIDSMFEKFTQADASITRKFGGTGLGLAITKQLVTLMGGHIHVESVEGKGSTFWFVIPCKNASEADVHEQSDVKAIQSRIRENRRPIAEVKVLLVEDYAVNQVFAEKLLRKFGVRHIDIAETGVQALLKYRTNTYDMIFMDCQMPEMDGYQATEKLRQLEDGTPLHTPIVAMTANAMMGDREKCLKAGMDDYLSKPLRAGHLKKILEAWFILDNDKSIIATDKPLSPKETDIPIDMEQLRIFTDGDPEEEKALFKLFLEQALAMIGVLQQSTSQDKYDAWKSAAHRFKGSSGNLGAIKLHHLCKRAEVHFEDNEAKKLEMLAAIKAETSRVEEFFNA